MVLKQSHLSRFIGWIEERIVELSYLLLLFGFAVGTVNLFTHGSFLNYPAVDTAWAVTQAVAIDGSFFVKVKSFAVALYHGRPLVALLYLPLVVLLAVVAWLVNDIQSMAQVQGISIDTSIINLGLNLNTLTTVRAGLVVLVAISIGIEQAIMREIRTKKDQASSSKDVRSFTKKKTTITPVPTTQTKLPAPKRPTRPQSLRNQPTRQVIR